MNAKQKREFLKQWYVLLAKIGAKHSARRGDDRSKRLNEH